MPTDDRPAWQTEIIEPHEFFEQLFLGTTTSLDRADHALHGDFTMAGPHGTRSPRAQVMDQLEAGIGHSAELSIAVEGFELIAETDDLVVAEYIEVHRLSDDRTNRRRSTVVFRKEPDGPNGLRWLRVHETWVEPTG